MLQQSEQGRCLVEGFPIFFLDVGVVHDSAPGPEADGACAVDEGADGDVGVHGAVESQVADGAGVDSAAMGLQFFDDFHGPDLGCAGDGAAGEAGSQE